MKAQHTPEPWFITGLSASTITDKNAVVTALIPELKAQADICDQVTRNANAARIVACVNACAGLSDPAADLAALREALQQIVAMPDLRNAAMGSDAYHAWLIAGQALSRTERGEK